MHILFLNDSFWSIPIYVVLVMFEWMIMQWVLFYALSYALDGGYRQELGSLSEANDYDEFFYDSIGFNQAEKFRGKRAACVAVIATVGVIVFTDVKFLVAYV